jgi:hypothetical protein
LVLNGVTYYAEAVATPQGNHASSFFK